MKLFFGNVSSVINAKKCDEDRHSHWKTEIWSI